MGNIQSTNMYAYCGNNPVMYLDPSGEFPIFLFLISLAIGGIIGGVSSVMSKESDETVLGALVGGFINGVVVTGAVTLGIAIGGVPGIVASSIVGGLGGAAGSVVSDLISGNSIDKNGMWLSAGYSAMISGVLAIALMYSGIYAAETFTARFCLAATPDIIAIAAGVLVGPPIPTSQVLIQNDDISNNIIFDYFGG